MLHDLDFLKPFNTCILSLLKQQLYRKYIQYFAIIPQQNFVEIIDDRPYFGNQEKPLPGGQ